MSKRYARARERYGNRDVAVSICRSWSCGDARVLARPPLTLGPVKRTLTCRLFSPRLGVDLDASAFSAYNDAASRGERIALIPLAGGAVRKLTTVPATASWAPDGKSLIYIESHGGLSNLMRYPIASGVRSR